MLCNAMQCYATPCNAKRGDPCGAERKSGKQGACECKARGRPQVWEPEAQVSSLAMTLAEMTWAELSSGGEPSVLPSFLLMSCVYDGSSWAQLGSSSPNCRYTLHEAQML